MQTIDAIKKEYNFDFSKNTTYGLGGKADVAYFPETEEEAIIVFDYVKKNFDKFAVLGNGSNVLVSDGFFCGAVISTKFLNKISVKGNVLSCQSGVNVSNLISFCIINGISGLEYLNGIPASVGGLALMNGGIHCRHVAEDIKGVRLFDGKLTDLTNIECNFGNKHSTMRDINCLILSVDFRFTPTDRMYVEAKARYFRELRKGQPKGKSCGCVFKNPDGLSAGKLIDFAGLKGFRIGGAYISKEHANFILNEGNRSSDVYNLISEVKRRVYEKFGVKLDEEVVYIGEFNDING